MVDLDNLRQEGWPDAADEIERLRKALHHAREALFWHDGMAFEMDGVIVGQELANILDAAVQK